MKNAVLMIAYQNLELTKEAVASIFSQDVPVYLWFIDNGSTDGTWEWVKEYEPPSPHEMRAHRSPENVSPVVVINRELSTLFALGYDKVFGVPNDAVLPFNMFRELLRWPRGIVCASMTSERDFPRIESATAVNECTPLAMGLIRKWVYEALVTRDGYFLDEGFFHYASDCDLALRMASCGIRGVQLDIPYYHFGSASLKLSGHRREMESQADRDRAYFERKWGFKVDSLEYGKVASDPNWSVGK